MRTILVLNAKGGSGKTTLATNLAGYLASEGAKIALVDLDPQGSSLDWLCRNLSCLSRPLLCIRRSRLWGRSQWLLSFFQPREYHPWLLT